MQDDPIPGEHHVTRYCSPVRVDDGAPMASAFELRTDEQFLSVNWLECWGDAPVTEALEWVRHEVGRGLQLREGGVFAILNVDDVKVAVTRITGAAPRVTHQPTPIMQSHAGVFDFGVQHRDVAVELAVLAKTSRIELARSG